jgi:hypothetical protein
MGKTFKFVVPDVQEHEYVEIRKKKTAVVRCEILPDNEVRIIGNSLGLEYLAKHLAAMALLEKHNGLHIHLDPLTDKLDSGSAVLTICNLDFGFGS